MDIASFVPFGIHAAVFVLAQASLNKQRRLLLGQGFWVLWAAYGVLALSVYTILYVVTSLFLHGAVSYWQGLLGVLLSWAFVPLVNWPAETGLNNLIDLFDEPAYE